jgi:hypothetical protein
VSQSAFALLFSELIQYSQARSSTASELERRCAPVRRHARGPARPDAPPSMALDDIIAGIKLAVETTGTTRRIQFSDGRMLDVAIPKGASEGQVIRLKGQGAPGRGGQAGDALIELRIQPHPVFKRDGADLTMDLPVSVPDAVLGGKIQVPTPEGAVMMTIPKGSNSGKVLRLKGRGAYANGKRGDLLAKLVVTLPETPDDELVRFATEWRERRPYKPGR